MDTMETSLAALASSIPGVIEVDDVIVTVGDVTHDSRHVDALTMFVAVRGATTDGHDFVESVAASGCPAVMVEERTGVAIPHIVVADSRRAMAHLARVVHGLPDTTMTMVGITGTNGKTTVAAMLEAILRAAGMRVGVIGTLGARIDGDPVPLARTTPESTDLQRLLARMRVAGVETVVMEVSSHALALHRVEGIGFDVVAFTNLSRDHLDFHHTMDAYFAEKAKLFEPQRSSAAVINVADAAGAELAAMSDMPTSSVAVAPIEADIVGVVTDRSRSVDIDVMGAGRNFSIRLPFVGGFNAENALVAVGVAIRLGVSPRSIQSGLEGMEPIPGRMERLTISGGPTVYVDYAHTPAAVERVVDDVRKTATARVIAVIGAGGDRDRDKRTAMGAAAGRCDTVIVTNDNPRSEDPAAIAEAVALGASAAGVLDLMVELDRVKAIRRAIVTADEDDIVLVLGKGHEQGQDVAGTVLPFDDVAVVREELERRAQSASHT